MDFCRIKIIILLEVIIWLGKVICKVKKVLNNIRDFSSPAFFKFFGFISTRKEAMNKIQIDPRSSKDGLQSLFLGNFPPAN